MKIKHSFVSQKADGPDNTLVRPSDWNAEHVIDGVFAPVRQTVLSGSVDSSGLANFLSAGTGLSVNLSAQSVPLVVAFASGFDASGAVDYIGRITSDITPAWSGLTASSTLFLYIERNPTTGELSFNFTNLVPVYAYIAPSSPASGQHWFDISSMKMKVWNGTAWEEKQRVFVGECVTGTSSVTVVHNYAIMGLYDSGWFTVSANTDYQKLHRFGMDQINSVPIQIVAFQARKADGSGNVVDVANSSIYTGTSNYGAGVRFTSRNAITIHACAYPYHDRDVASSTSAQYRIVLSRGW